MEYRDLIKRKISKEIFNIVAVCFIPVSIILYMIYDLQNPPASDLHEICFIETLGEVGHQHQDLESILQCNVDKPNDSLSWSLADC